MDSDTIYALSSGAGRAGVAVIRVSGAAAAGVLERLTLRSANRLEPRKAHLLPLYSFDSRDECDRELDRALVLWFPAPGSFTGEDLVEFHVHGGRAVIKATFRAIGACDGTRVADPGEFTKRAFLNNKMDLTAAEGIGDLIDAQTDGQRRQAARQMAGELAELYDGWRARLLRVAAHLEATIDFTEEDIPDDLDAHARASAEAIVLEIRKHLEGAQRGCRLRDGVRVAILGRPNAGKSTLLNVLAAREAAIVSDQAGTTRDVIEVHLDLGGVPAIVSDTAGLRQTNDLIEKEGVRRAEQVAAEADLRVLVLDAINDVQASSDSIQPQEFMGPGDIYVVNKIDLLSSDVEDGSFLASADGVEEDHNVHRVALKIGRGVESLIDALSSRVTELAGVEGEIVPTRQRHVEALKACAAAMEQAVGSWGTGSESELVAEEVRSAVGALGRLTGRVDVEEVLGVIFQDFCIGK